MAIQDRGSRGVFMMWLMVQTLSTTRYSRNPAEFKAEFRCLTHVQGRSLRQHLFDQLAVNVCQAEVAALELEGELLVFDAE